MIQSFEGKMPRIAKSAFIHEGAWIIGDVEIGEDTNVWPGAIIRADFGKIKIGSAVAVEDNCVIHSGSPNAASVQVLEIGNNVSIGHGAVINCRKIGNFVLIGINSTILHDVEIADYCIIGAGSMVREAMHIPEGSFVAGVPAEIKKSITTKQTWWVKEAPAGYVKMAERHRKSR